MIITTPLTLTPPSSSSSLPPQLSPLILLSLLAQPPPPQNSPVQFPWALVSSSCGRSPSGSEPNFFHYTLTCDPALEGLVQPDAVVTEDTQASITGFEDGATYLCSLTAGVEGYVTAPAFLTVTPNESGMLHWY